MKTVDQILKEKADLFKEKGREYGHSYKEFDSLLECLFGKELKIKEEDYNSFFIFVMILHKIKRTANTLLTDHVSIDSIKDIQVYAAMLEEVVSEKQEFNKTRGAVWEEKI